MTELDKTADSTGAMDKDDVITFLGDDNDDKETIPLKEDKDKKETVKKETKKPREDSEEVDESEIDELKDVEDNLEKPDEKKLELLTPVSKNAVLKKYPDLFKDFPTLENTYHREQAFSERFATVKDADNALKDSETLERFEEDLINGETKNMLLAAKQADSNAFNRIVDNYLTTLKEVDEKSYYHVVGNTIKHTIIAMVEEAKSSSDDKLREAAEVLNYFVFGSSKFEGPRNLTESKGKSTDSAKLDSEKKEFAAERLKTVTDELYTKITKSIRNTVDVNIDPQNKMREYDKRNATRDVLEKLESLISKDTRFRTIMDKLWENAGRSNYSKESIDKIQSLFFSKAKNLLPDIIRKARSEALNGKKPEPKSEVKKDKRASESRDPSNSDNKKQVIPKGMSTFDFLNAED